MAIRDLHPMEREALKRRVLDGLVPDLKRVFHLCEAKLLKPDPRRMWPPCEGVAEALKSACAGDSVL